MHERFSDRARHAMALANLEATRLKHNFLAPAHLMLGIIAEGKCVATETLRALDVDLNTVREQVRAMLGEGTDEKSVGLRPQTKAMKEVIAKAIVEARNFGHRYVGTEHLILGLIQVEEGIPAKVLTQQGINVNSLRERTLTFLRSDVGSDHDLAHSRHGHFEWVHQQELAKAFRSPTFWHTMIMAVDSANRHGAGEIEPLHLLHALLRNDSSGIAKMLEERGVTLSWVREKLEANGTRN